MNSSLEVIETFHNDIVHDIAFDWYGRRLATCSSDQKVKIWTKGPDNKWIKSYDFTAHDAEIFKVKWAHPDFGSIIATCSYDKSFTIWEEPKVNSIHLDSENMQESSSSTSKPWTLKARLLESKEAVLYIEFAPKHQGLVLAAATAEGIVRIYEAPEIMNLQSWRIIGEIMASPFGVNSISWNKNPYDPAMLAIGCKDEYSSEQRADLMEPMEEKMVVVSQKMEDKSSASNNSPLVIYYNKDGNWSLLAALNCVDHKPNALASHKGAVNCVSWSALNGRSFDLLASCGKDGIIVWQLKYEDGKLKVLRNENLDNKTVVWKVEWNIMGTILASSDQQNSIRLWKNNGVEDKWKCINIIEDEDSK